jgi:dephospho-CoA kinase
MFNRDVGFIGLAGSGKDTAALVLLAHGWRRMAFADRLKGIARQFGWNGIKDDAGRKLLQDLGMAARRYNQNFWINEAMAQLFEVSSNFAEIPRVWTDVRFENEADFVRYRGGIIIRIVRPSLKSEDQHESELNQYHIDADTTVMNDGTIEDLKNTILRILETYEKR